MKPVEDYQMVRQRWSGVPMISPDVIELIARWEVADLTDVPYGGSQAMQEVSYVPYSNKGLIWLT